MKYFGKNSFISPNLNIQNLMQGYVSIFRFLFMWHKKYLYYIFFNFSLFHEVYKLRAIWYNFLNIISSSLLKVIDKSKSMEEIPEWFIGCRMNYAENLLQGDDNDIALISTGN